jgi:peroxin-2
MMRTADDAIDEGAWECLRCGEGVRNAERWTGDVVEEHEDGSSWDGDGFSSISDFESGTDMSATSGGSLRYSDAGLSE